MKQTLLAAAMSAATLFIAASPAQAAVVPACLLDGSAPAAIDCRGYFTGNLISGNAGDRATQLAQLQSMGFAGSVPAALFSSPFKLSNLNGATSLVFPTQLYGLTYIGIHWGGGAGGGRSALYEFNFASAVSSITILGQNTGGSSNAVLYGTQVAPPPPAVPEPATWALMMGGLGLVGVAMRRRKTAVSFV